MHAGCRWACIINSSKDPPEDALLEGNCPLETPGKVVVAGKAAVVLEAVRIPTAQPDTSVATSPVAKW